ncbi:hypothetical protein E2C01_049879 [Portunus trituberculatus]|uniref:Peptidase aspartic putative domain-containing protein n=1 Tax=Portunus trituberculatus TaxID=210409 RepID=A0A5B7G7J3_PORTR|nr:hypothetical protein [Portunus trituberculatus]
MDKIKEATLRKERGTAKSRFTRKVNLFRECHAKGDPYDVLEAIHEELVSAFRDLEGKCENLISFLEDSGQEEEVQEACTYLSNCDNDRCEALRLLSIAKSKVTVTGGNCQVKVEALKPPSMAKKLHAKSRDVMMSMVKVGNVMERCTSKEYTINVHDNSGVEYELKAVGMDDISAQVSVIDLSQLANIFPDTDMELMTRPSGRIDMLIGIDYCELFPQVIRTEGKLQLLANNFGYCLRGSHPLLQGETNNVGQLTAVVNKAVVDVYQTSLSLEENDDLKES